MAKVGVDIMGAGIIKRRVGIVPEDGGQVPEAAEGEIGHEGKLEADQEGQSAGPVQKSSEHGARGRSLFSGWGLTPEKQKTMSAPALWEKHIFPLSPKE